MTARSAEPYLPEIRELPSEPQFSTGILPYQAIQQAIENREIQADEAITEVQIQPASLDLRLGAVAYRVRTSFLSGGRATVADKLESLAMHQCDLVDGAVLERGCLNIVFVRESRQLDAAPHASR